MILKVCGVTNVDDAIASVEVGALYVGMIIGAKSPRLIDPTRAKEISSSLPKHVKPVGVVDARKEPMLDVVLNSGVRVVQLHWATYESYLRWRDELKHYGISVALASPSFRDWPIERLDAEYVLVDVKDHQRKAEEVGRARKLGIRVGVAGGLRPDNLSKVLKDLKVELVDVSSGVEREPGRKDLELLRRFAEEVIGSKNL